MLLPLLDIPTYACFTFVIMNYYQVHFICFFEDEITFTKTNVRQLSSASSSLLHTHSLHGEATVKYW